MPMIKEFKEFLLKQNVVALAIAVVVATALSTLVKAVVDDFIMPIVVAIGPGGEWQKATWSVGSVKFGVGDFIAAHSAPVALRERILYVRVLQPALH